MDFLADTNRTASVLTRLRSIGERAAPTAGDSPAVSFEFFPPTDPEMESVLWTSVRRLATLAPRFVSVTYGADGSTRDRTLDVVSRLSDETTLTVAPHITSIGSSRESVRELARYYWSKGIRPIVALRGDAPGASPSHVPSADEFRWGLDLVRGLRSVAGFEISVAAYPEVHPEARNSGDDLDNLRRKIGAGATRAITQFFFGNSSYLRFRDDCAATGVDVPIVPGILPILRFSQVQRFARRCGASIPASIARRFEGLEDDADTRRLIGTAIAIEQVDHLRRHGVTDFHFYTLNRSDMTYATCHAIGVRANKPITVSPA